MAVQYLMSVNELAERLTPIGCGQLASRFTNPNQQWYTLSWGFHTVWGGIDPWITVSVPGLLEL